MDPGHTIALSSETDGSRDPGGNFKDRQVGVKGCILSIQSAKSLTILLLSCSSCCAAWGVFTCFLILFRGHFFIFSYQRLPFESSSFCNWFLQILWYCRSADSEHLQLKMNTYELDKPKKYSTVSIIRFQGDWYIWTGNFDSVCWWGLLVRILGEAKSPE